MGVIERKHGTYRDLDAFQVIEDGRVMVALDQPGHRLPEEYVPAYQLAGAAADLESAVRLLNNARTMIIDTDDRRAWEAERARLRTLVGGQ